MSLAWISLLTLFLVIVLSCTKRVHPGVLALAVIVAGHLVDSSPLSTIGALCVASAGPSEDRHKLFMTTLFWGLAMAGVGALWCLVLYGWMW